MHPLKCVHVKLEEFPLCTPLIGELRNCDPRTCRTAMATARMRARSSAAPSVLKRTA
ncbi:hypothetical protein AAFF_G00125510 [Aldrovandia affinis]|uniref:Uncharacterized protein n=1 Tax=Aldrovandia affinis TaxID=143900 RepID=A0AAD7RRM5_9TELE|nr:hypothetical protein AAFF_G00125510 [Aldrovandia affinis]